MALLADFVVLVHLGFILFATLGGLLALRWRWMPWLHVPAAAWAAFVELTDRVCPLTPLENTLRVGGGGAGYAGNFVEHCVEPIVYPADLTRTFQVALAAALLGLNLVVYAIVWRRSRG